MRHRLHPLADVRRALGGLRIVLLGSRLLALCGEHYSLCYDAEARDTVADLFKNDIDRWGYSFESAS